MYFHTCFASCLEKSNQGASPNAHRNIPCALSVLVLALWLLAPLSLGYCDKQAQILYLYFTTFDTVCQIKVKKYRSYAYNIDSTIY